MGLVGAITIKRVRGINLVDAIGPKDPAVVDQSGEAACRVRPAAESEQKHAIAWAVVAREEAVAVTDVLGDPDPERPAEQVVAWRCADPGHIMDQLGRLGARSLKI